MSSSTDDTWKDAEKIQITKMMWNTTKDEERVLEANDYVFDYNDKMNKADNDKITTTIDQIVDHHYFQQRL